MADDLTDSYVASILARDAKESFEKYPFVGTDAFLPSRPPANHPKPNTRFLRNIIRDTDNHNAALLAKEAADSKARLDGLVSNNKRSAADVRKRQLGHITAHLTGGMPSRQRAERSKEQNESKTKSNEKGERIGKSSSHHSRREYEIEDRKDRDRKSSRRSDKRSRSPSNERSSRAGQSSKARSRSPRDNRDRESRHRRRSPHRERKEDKGERAHKRRHRRSRSPDIGRGKSVRNSFNEKQPIPEQPLDEDSDPLDDIIGPRPPPPIRSRGRGIITSAESNIDSHFATDYDPSNDVQIDPAAEKDWDEALEAFRDRQKWKQQGAERLRTAGFTEEQVKKWENGGEKREEDVKWAKKGEKREWDRGKVKGFEPESPPQDGVEIDMEWGRLKGA